MSIVVESLVRRQSIFSSDENKWKTILFGAFRESIHPRTFYFHLAETARTAVHKIQTMPRPANN
jgi:hypothetical protein